MLKTPDLTNEFHPVPKVYKDKKAPVALGAGKKTDNWNKGRADLKKQFAAWNITTCEIRLDGCLKDNFLGFAHTERRVNLTLDETRDPSKVVLSCQQCHNTADNEMLKADSKKLLEKIVSKRRTKSQNE